MNRGVRPEAEEAKEAEEVEEVEEAEWKADSSPPFAESGRPGSE
jgi:hypothetical protein